MRPLNVLVLLVALPASGCLMGSSTSTWEDGRWEPCALTDRTVNVHLYRTRPSDRVEGWLAQPDFEPIREAAGPLFDRLFPRGWRQLRTNVEVLAPDDSDALTLKIHTRAVVRTVTSSAHATAHATVVTRARLYSAQATLIADVSSRVDAELFALFLPVPLGRSPWRYWDAPLESFMLCLEKLSRHPAWAEASTQPKRKRKRKRTARE